MLVQGSAKSGKFLDYLRKYQIYILTRQLVS